MHISDLELEIANVQELRRLPLRNLIARHRLLIVRGIPVLPAATFEQLVTDIAGGRQNLLRWDFGYLMEVTEDLSKENYLFSNESVPLHWDGAFHVSPSILAFQCVEAASIGGATIFSDTTALIAQSAPRDLEEWSKLSLVLDTEKKAHYGGHVVVPMLSQHPVTGLPTLRFAEPVTTEKNPVHIKIDGPATRDWLRILPDLLYSESVAYEHTWQTGDILFADNHTLLHGRRAFSGSGRRCLQRVQILR